MLTPVKKKKMTPFSEKLNPRDELTRLGDIDFAGSATNDVLMKTANGYAFDPVSLDKISGIVYENGNIGLGVSALSSVTSGTDNVAVGSEAGAGLTTSASCVCAGDDCASAGGSFGDNFVAVGKNSALDSAGAESVAVGFRAYAPSQYAVAVGSSTNATADGAVAIGVGASASGSHSLCHGDFSSAQGSNSVVLGQNTQNTHDNCVMLNASGSSVSSGSNGSFHVKPIAVETSVSLENHINLPTTASGFTHVLVFNPTTSEIRAVAQPTIP